MQNVWGDNFHDDWEANGFCQFHGFFFVFSQLRFGDRQAIGGKNLLGLDFGERIATIGAGAGNTPLEVFLAVCDRMGVETGVDLFKAMDVAEDLIVPLMDHMVRVDRDSLTLGWAGVYSSFLLFAKRSAAKYGLSARDILVELGRKKMIGGQEDMIQDTALTMAKERGVPLPT